ncbi:MULTISPECIES: flagellar biosynthetic protein FliQ [Novosphingobium]|uniref:Flagellar biosynthetic protein FliQ n=2 Tax=Novosphingobium TaxID=165696 RepID=A0A7W6CRS8_9SPHN|nr:MULTISPECIES: flagellar biosynthetic protein FliQ [Novosphingobium]MBB3956557.1 flagellar biosynthetic protein FliQ [Novosphingobium sediminicola]MBN9143206.1 flagellar biosynthetic protein FliQ [Novosphingobium sp.]MDR6706294.1 flagellar biosynthetic protein FliQ [Novosphingobium sp. 1748]NKJ01155.1 flagellar biosynthetic protein FliQ [Novosphingobium sp. SG707]ODU82699.1 MAG: flagellar biosynthetic protein FliQ [Novosphingobium sp. SCN 63-17]
MDETSPLLALADRMLYVVALCGAPVLLTSLAVGLVVSIFQAATSVNEQTLTFIPKVVATGLVLVLFGAGMLGLIEDFAREIFAAIAHLGAMPGQ